MASSMRMILVLVALAFLQNALACVSGSCKNGMCSDIPKDNTYYLTSFCDKSVACGSFSGNCNEYYAADYTRFGCGSVSKFASSILFSPSASLLRSPKTWSRSANVNCSLFAAFQFLAAAARTV